MNNLFFKVYLEKFVFRKRVIFSADVTNLALYKRWNDSTLFQTFYTVEDILSRGHSVRKTRTRLNVSSEETLAILARLKKKNVKIYFKICAGKGNYHDKKFSSLYTLAMNTCQKYSSAQ